MTGYYQTLSQCSNDMDEKQFELDNRNFIKGNNVYTFHDVLYRIKKKTVTHYTEPTKAFHKIGFQCQHLHKDCNAKTCKHRCDYQ